MGISCGTTVVHHTLPHTHYTLTTHTPFRSWWDFFLQFSCACILAALHFSTLLYYLIANPAIPTINDKSNSNNDSNNNNDNDLQDNAAFNSSNNNFRTSNNASHGLRTSIITSHTMMVVVWVYFSVLLRAINLRKVEQLTWLEVQGNAREVCILWILLVDIIITFTLLLLSLLMIKLIAFQLKQQAARFSMYSLCQWLGLLFVMVGIAFKLSSTAAYLRQVSETKKEGKRREESESKRRRRNTRNWVHYIWYVFCVVVVVVITTILLGWRFSRCPNACAIFGFVLLHHHFVHCHIWAIYGTMLQLLHLQNTPHGTTFSTVFLY